MALYVQPCIGFWCPAWIHSRGTHRQHYISAHTPIFECLLLLSDGEGVLPPWHASIFANFLSIHTEYPHSHVALTHVMMRYAQQHHIDCMPSSSLVLDIMFAIETRDNGAQLMASNLNGLPWDFTHPSVSWNPTTIQPCAILTGPYNHGFEL